MRNLIVVMSIFISSCALGRTNPPSGPACQPKELQATYLYITNLVDQVCSKYIITNRQTMAVSFVADLPLVAGGECDRAVGFSRGDYLRAKNSITDALRCRY